MFGGWGKVMIAALVVGLGVTAAVLFMPMSAADGRKSPPAVSGPPRIVSISPSATEIIFAIDAGEMLVGVDRFSNYPPAALALPRVGGLNDPDLERIATLRPTVLILRGRHELIEALCRDQGIRVYFDPTQTVQGIYHNVLSLGELTGHQQQAQQLHDSMTGELDAVAKSVAGRKPVRVLFVISRDKDTLSNVFSIGKPSYLTSLIEMAGGVSVFANLDIDYPQVTLESILAAQPEVIIDAMPDEVGNPERLRVLAEQWKALSGVPAVINNRVHVVTEPYMTIPSPRITRLARDLCGWFHPDLK